MFNLEKLLDTLTAEEENIYIQTHNFPDPDAVASAFGLQQLLSLKKIKAQIIYDGVIQRTALVNMISDLQIDIRHSDEFNIQEEDKILIVDGCKRNTNVTDLPGIEIAVIDHHPVKEPDDVEFVDIRPEVGSCSSIITSYYKELNLPVPGNAATVLLTGLFRDTDSMTRGVSPVDVEAYALLFETADYGKASSLVLNNITLEDLSYYEYVIKHLKREGSLAFCAIKEGCNQNLLGILGDFLLSLEEVRFTALFAENGHVINISFRNETDNIHAAALMKKVVSGIGTGGGHREMAGGLIYNKEDFHEEEMFSRLSSLINS